MILKTTSTFYILSNIALIAAVVASLALFPGYSIAIYITQILVIFLVIAPLDETIKKTSSSKTSDKTVDNLQSYINNVKQETERLEKVAVDLQRTHKKIIATMKDTK